MRAAIPSAVPLVIFTDLDGTLLDHDTYSFHAAREGLRLVEESGAALVFCSSKTRAEIEWLQEELGVRHPFISENGGALFLPDGYFPFDVSGSHHVPGYQVIEFGRRYVEVVIALRRAALQVDARVAAFHSMSADEIARDCGLPPSQARLAKLREYDEPFRVLDAREERHYFQPAAAGQAVAPVRPVADEGAAPPASQLPRLSARARVHAALRQAGFRCTRGSRFDHVTGVTDKGVAVTRLCELYAEAAGTVVPSVGLGDAINDLPLLKAVHVPIVVPNRGSDAARLLQKVPSARVTERKGPAGWSEAIKRLVGSTTWRSSARLFERGGR